MIRFSWEKYVWYGVLGVEVVLIAELVGGLL